MSKVIPIVTQNVDRVIRVRDYDYLFDDLLVTSFFRTIQGEGPYSGHPAVFLRLAGCNFGDKSDHCAWCDTSFQFDKGTAYTPQDLLDALTTLPGYRKHDILVVTGGEPTLQRNLVDFIARANYHFSKVQIETNGTQATFFAELEALASVLKQSEAFWDFPSIVVSPKASTKAGRIPQPASIVLRAAEALKFVISSDPADAQHTVPEWVEVVRAQNPRMKIYVSPMAVYKRPYAGEVSSVWDADLINQEATAANYAYAAQYAMKHGMLLSLQTHLFTSIP